MVIIFTTHRAIVGMKDCSCRKEHNHIHVAIPSMLLLALLSLHRVKKSQFPNGKLAEQTTH